MLTERWGVVELQTPILTHPQLPDGVPCVASFHDDRNRLSYYYPVLKQISGVRTPLTYFSPVNGDFDSYPDIEYRDMTRFMQSISTQEAFVRSDYSSGKFDGESGSKVESQDPHDIESTVLELLRQLGRSKRYIGGRIAIREWLSIDREVRYFIRGGDILYRESMDDGSEYPDGMAKNVASVFDTFPWSCDFVRHEKTGKWYCTDMGLDGLYHTGKRWIAISEHLNSKYSPERHVDGMPQPKALLF